MLHTVEKLILSGLRIRIRSILKIWGENFMEQNVTGGNSGKYV